MCLGNVTRNIQTLSKENLWKTETEQKASSFLSSKMASVDSKMGSVNKIALYFK
jgi:hypothetical protein